MGAYTPLRDFFFALGLAAFVVEAWAFIDAIRRPGQAFVATGKQTKQLWLIILGVAAVVGLYGAVYGVGPVSILPMSRRSSPRPLISLAGVLAPGSRGSATTAPEPARVRTAPGKRVA